MVFHTAKKAATGRGLVKARSLFDKPKPPVTICRLAFLFWILFATIMLSSSLLSMGAVVPQKVDGKYLLDILNPGSVARSGAAASAEHHP